MTKDFKIGLMVGSVLLVVAMIWISTRNKLNPQTGLAQDITIDIPEEPKIDPSERTAPPSFGSDPDKNSQVEVRKPITTNSFFPEPEAPPVAPPADPPLEKPVEKIVTVKEILPKPVNTVTVPEETIHVVASGESLSSIAQKYYGKSTSTEWDKITNANPALKDPKRLKIGMRLVIPD